MNTRPLILIASMMIGGGLAASAFAEKPATASTSLQGVMLAEQSTTQDRVKKPGKLQRTLSQQDIKKQYKKSTWQMHQRRLKMKSGSGVAEIPQTDCPPLPTQDCLDTWNELQARPMPSQHEVKRQWKKDKWQRNRQQLRGKGGQSAIPPTDCPPLPTQDCLDTWDVKAN